jgi:hypothetical protein
LICQWAIGSDAYFHKTKRKKEKEKEKDTIRKLILGDKLSD